MTIAWRQTTGRERRGAFAATMCVLLVAAGVLSCAAPAQASPGDLDPSFSGDGMQTTDFGGTATGAAVAVQANGKIVAAGASWLPGSPGEFALARYEPDGSLDLGFSEDGKLTTSFGGDSGALDLALRADGKILAAGYGPGGFALALYNADGSLDSSFDGDGKETTDFGRDSRAYGVALQADGKILAAGTDGSDFILVRYNPDGSLDTSFGQGGRVATDFGGSYDAANGVVVQADGRIVAAGLRAAGIDGGDLTLARYNPDGSLDMSFSGDGWVSMDIADDDSASDVVIQPDGKIVAVGSTYSFNAGATNFVLARFNADGSPDSSFGLFGGLQLTAFTGTDRANAVAIDRGGRIVSVGDAGGDFGLARHTAVGSPDTTFSGDGMLVTDFGGSEGWDQAADVAIQADGAVVVTGDSNGAFALARYEGDSGPPAPVPGTPPMNLTAPTISGTATEGQTLTARTGDWSGTTPIAFAYEWQRCDAAASGCVGIAGMTATTYVLTAADVGHTIRIRQTATNAHGTRSADSAATAVVKAMTGTIAGTVRSSRTGAPLAAATVACGTHYSAGTASDGSYRIPNVPPGSYVCTAAAKQHVPSTQTVIVKPAQTTTANFTLIRR